MRVSSDSMDTEYGHPSVLRQHQLASGMGATARRGAFPLGTLVNHKMDALPDCAGDADKSQMYHYVECGLDDVYLLNGFKRFASPRGTSVAISDVEKLHRAIGVYLCRQRRKLRGREIRFLRQELLMTQAALAHLLEVTLQTIHRWEAEKSGMPKAAETIVRLIYSEQAGSGRGSIRKGMERLADLALANEPDPRSEIVFERMTDDRNAATSGQHSAMWQLAARDL